MDDELLCPQDDCGVGDVISVGDELDDLRKFTVVDVDALWGTEDWLRKLVVRVPAALDDV